MARKRMTQMFPWLLPLRKRQRRFCFYWRMRRDGNHYAGERREDRLPHLLFQSRCPMYNPNTGFDMMYQENKVFNLKLAAIPLDRLVIKPGETFSFWQRVRHADRKTRYKDALAEVNGELVAERGGGLCQISNLLCWMFLHTPLTLVERHGHETKAFPEPPSDAPMGVDATVSEGWLDLRARNDTDITFQITLAFEERHIIGTVWTSQDMGKTFQVVNGKPSYYRKEGAVFEEVDVIRKTLENTTGASGPAQLMYRNKCEIRYRLPDEIPILEEADHEHKKRGNPVWRLFA